MGKVKIEDCPLCGLTPERRLEDPQRSWIKTDDVFCKTKNCMLGGVSYNRKNWNGKVNAQPRNIKTVKGKVEEVIDGIDRWDEEPLENWKPYTGEEGE